MNDLVVQSIDSNDAATAVFIMGPTATGKTDLAIALYNEIDSELISVDSALVYREMNIGTAKPDAETLQRAPHHLIDMIDPSEVYSAGQFRDDALHLIERNVENHRTPVLVGGTMLYFNTLQKGMADMPEVPAEIKRAIEQEAVEKGITAMHQRLSNVDPESALRIHENDTQRIKRALELFDFTKKTLSQFWQEQADTGSSGSFPYHRVKIALMPPDRVELRKRIASRLDNMLQNGFVEEVECLFKRGDLHAQMPSIRAVGYRQVWAYLSGEYDFDEMREKAIIATAQLAKRQMTWLRKEQNCNFIDPEKLNTPKVLKNLKFLLS